MPAAGANLGVIVAHDGLPYRRLSLFNRSERIPAAPLYGNASLLDAFRNAPAGSRLRMLGRYQNDDYLLAEVTPVDASSTPAPTAQPH